MGLGIIPLAILCFVAAAGTVPAPDVGEIVQKSARATDADRIANSEYDFKETDRQSDGSTRTYSVHMLFGSFYRELIAIDGSPLPASKRREEKRKLDQETRRRRRESPEARQHRVAEFQKEQHRDERFMQEFVRAFDFKLTGQGEIDKHQVYIIQATPRAGYQATDNASKVLTGMGGQLWIDKQTYQWVKVEADVIHPASIDGFLAKVEPGTHFELEKLPIGDGIWLPTHFTMTSKAKILSAIKHNRQQDETYFDYRKAQPQQLQGSAGSAKK